MVKHILAPIDGSATSEQAVFAAMELAQSLGARLTLFYAVPTADAYAYATLPAFMKKAAIGEQSLAQIHQKISAAANTYLAELVTRLRQVQGPYGSPELALESVESDEPHRAILDAAQRLDCDLIVMASHGRRGVGALLLGSETQKVLTHSTLPVLIWRPQDESKS